MSTIQLPGLFTGIDTNTLIAQLMAIESRTMNMYEARKEEWTEKKSAMSTVQEKMTNLQSALKALDDSQELRAYSVASSDSDIITAEATYNAYEGNHTIIVNQLAAAERWVHTNGLEYAESYVGEGTFIYSYNNTETTIETTATTTLEDLVGLINNDADNPGVTASMLYYNDAYHLVMNGNDAGTDYEVKINASNTEVWEAESAFTDDTDNATLSTLFTDLDQFSGTLVGDESITITGQQHDGTAVSESFTITDGMTLNHLISEINDAFSDTATATLVNGEIRLTDHTYGTSQMQLSLSYDQGSGSTTFTMPTISRSTEGGSVSADLTGFATADFTETQSAQDSQIKVDGWPVGASDWIERSSNTVDDVIGGVTLHLHDVTDATGEQITLTRDIESVKTKINSMVTSYNLMVSYIQEQTDYNEDTEEAGLLIGSYFLRMIREDVRSPFIDAVSGFVEDTDEFTLAGQLGLELDSDGVLSFDTTAFDEAIGDNYLDALALIGADKSGSSDSNTIQFYNASSTYTTAGNYDVQVTVSGGAITNAQIKLSSESTYRDMTVSGNIITGNSTFDDNGDPVYAENGLQLDVDLTTDGSYTATVRVKQGFAGAVRETLDDFLKSTTGPMAIELEHADDQLELLDDKIENEEYRLEMREKRLRARFSRMEKTLTLMQRQLNALGMA